MANKYVGPRSCYARYEGAYVPREGGGINAATYFSVLALILRDMRRGWGYDEHCNRVPIDRERAMDRWRYAIALCYTHEERWVCDLLKRITYYDPEARKHIEEGRLPPHAVVFLAGSRARELAEELVRLGVARPGQVIVLERGGTAKKERVEA